MPTGNSNIEHTQNGKKDQSKHRVTCHYKFMTR